MNFHTLAIGHLVEYLFDFPSNKRFRFILMYMNFDILEIAKRILDLKYYTVHSRFIFL